MVVLDATTLLLFLQPDAGIPTDSKGRPVARAQERITLLIEQLEKSRTIIMIPAPALSEALVRLDSKDASMVIEEINRHSTFTIQAFDSRAAIEVAAMMRLELQGGKGKMKAGATWAKVKFDRQIVAIAAVAGADHIYSDDRHIRTLGKRVGIAVSGVSDLPLPPEDPNLNLFERP